MQKKRNPTPATKSTAHLQKLIIEIHRHWTEEWLYYVIMSSRPHSTVNADILQSLYAWR